MANQKDSIAKRQRRERWKRILLTILVIVAVSWAGVTYVRISTEGRFAFREAKNVRLAFEMLEIEVHGSGKTVYDFNKPSGMADEIRKRVAEVISEDGVVHLTEYNRKQHKVTGFTYEQGKYRVTYQCDENGTEHWRVYYNINIFKYDGDK